MTRAELMDIEEEMQQIEELERMAMATDLPNMPSRPVLLTPTIRDVPLPDIDNEVFSDPDIHHEVPADPDIHHEVPADPDIHHEVPADPDIHHEVPADPDVEHGGHR